MKFFYTLIVLMAVLIVLAAEPVQGKLFAASLNSEPVHACVIARDVDLTDELRARYAQCLGWKTDLSSPRCLGHYNPLTVTPLANVDEVNIMANRVSFYPDQRSYLQGDIEIQQGLRIVNAQTAYVYRDAKTNQVNRIELLGQVRYLEPNRLMIARKAIIYPEGKSGQVEDVLYRFNSERPGAALPAWGRAASIRRFPNQDYLLKQATYSHCAPEDNAWEIRADKITIDHDKSKGVARNAVLRIRDVPVFYTPYISFPTSRERKSGFLMPLAGYSNIGGFNLALPYYLNLAPNYDATLFPHVYTRRGLMLGGQFRYLNVHSSAVVEGHFMPQDRAFKQFLRDNAAQYPDLNNHSANRWSAGIHATTALSPNLRTTINVQQVSDDYFLQDFNPNLAVVTERQLLRQADLVYSGQYWQFAALAQSYQTLNPINLAPVAGIYERLPQLRANGGYNHLLFDANFRLLTQYDQFHRPGQQNFPEGPRFHLNPIVSMPQIRPWGFFTPSAELVENYYDVHFRGNQQDQNFNRTMPRYSLDSGLNFEKNISLGGKAFTQTLEPRLFYLNVPFRDQSQIPVYDSAYMIFNVDQLFRTNRFSGYDRIGDANQLAYAVTSRLLTDDTGEEKASFSIGQIRYFSDRRVQLCYNRLGNCTLTQNNLGELPSRSTYSPIASRAVYRLSPNWTATGDYVWDPATHAANNGHLNVHYQPELNHLINVSYSYLVDGDSALVAFNRKENANLHQANLSFAWPFSDSWSTLGAYSYNISKQYSMMAVMGFQYDSCCWAVRILGGRTFNSLNADAKPQYNNNVYLQILLKGLGSVANSDPYSLINTFIPGYTDPFHR